MTPAVEIHARVKWSTTHKFPPWVLAGHVTLFFYILLTAVAWVLYKLSLYLAFMMFEALVNLEQKLTSFPRLPVQSPVRMYSIANQHIRCLFSRLTQFCPFLCPGPDARKLNILEHTETVQCRHSQLILLLLVSSLQQRHRGNLSRSTPACPLTISSACLCALVMWQIAFSKDLWVTLLSVMIFSVGFIMVE